MPSFEIDRPGTYTLQLIVNDGMVDSDPDTVNITTINSLPVADAGLDDSVAIGQNVILDGRGSYDPDGDAFDYSWSITDKPKDSVAALSNPGAEITNFIVDAAGTYVAQLIVNDGTIDSKADTVIITTENSAPMADAGPDIYITAGETATLDGSASSDADADPLTCTWSFTSRPDESTAAIAAPHEIGTSFDADAAGIYVVQLIVNDGTVNSPAVTVTITVEPPPVKEPICGDSVLDPNEQCDDGNNTNDDGCTATCSIEPKPIVEPDPIVKPEPIVEPKPIVEPDPIVKPEPIVEPKPIVEPDPIVKPEPIVEPKPIGRDDEEDEDEVDDDRKDEIDDDDERDGDEKEYRSEKRRKFRRFLRYLWSKYFYFRR
jgi:cysteine-rich repeat protein